MGITHSEARPRVVDKCDANAVGNRAFACGHKSTAKLSTGMDTLKHLFPTPLKIRKYMFLIDYNAFIPKLGTLIVINWIFF
jgi:hypothetical protein